jgi:hypothetical protein
MTLVASVYGDRPDSQRGHNLARMDDRMKGGLIWTIVGILLIVALIIWISERT